MRPMFLESPHFEVSMVYINIFMNWNISRAIANNNKEQYFATVTQSWTDFMSNGMIDPQFNDEWFREDNETSVTNSQVIIFYTYIEIRKCSYCLHITQSKYINVGQNYTRNWPYDKFGPRFEGNAESST